MTMAYKDPTIGETRKEYDAKLATRIIPSRLLVKVKSESIIGKEKEEEEKEPRG